MNATTRTTPLSDCTGFLRVAPFPGSRQPALLDSTEAVDGLDPAKLNGLIARVSELRVGGSYWGAHPQLADVGYALVHVRDARKRAEAISRLQSGRSVLSTDTIAAPFDPWHLVTGAEEVVVDSDDELALIAAIAGVPLRCVGTGRFSELENGGRPALREAFRHHVGGYSYTNPYTGEPIALSEAIELCGFWRRMIDSNREITAATGFAFWKRETVAPLLWDGSEVPFASKPRSCTPPDRVAVWKSRTRPSTLARLERSGAHLIEVEDGFIRSAGLGADCIPPLSIVVDRLGIYFDPRGPSDLEQLLQQGEFTPAILERAKRLRELIVELGISKYGAEEVPLEHRRAGKRHLLVVGQVEDDRAVLLGLGPRTNLDLLRNVRQANRDAYLLYRPHPDVEAGHRSGGIRDEDSLALADEIVRTGPISALIALADEVHVNTSLAGFEALLRGQAVTTYGVPFYAGWGLTRDLGPVPARRTARRTIDELVAAALLLYPRYLDPQTRLPCPPEVLVQRLAEGRVGAKPSPLVRLRRLQGRWNRALAAVGLGGR